MNEVSFRGVPKKFRYYAKSLMKISPTTINDGDKIQNKTNTSGDVTDEDSSSSQSTKSDGKTVDPLSKKCHPDLPCDKNVLPTPPGSPEDDHSWTSSHVENSNKIHSEMSPMSLMSAIEHHRIGLHDLQLESSGKGGRRPQIKDEENHVVERGNSQNYLRYVPSLSGLPFISGDLENPIIARALASSAPKRHRGEKKAIPVDQKDDKYFERRKRNNMAAKKSRDARKSREDQIAVRANLLEKENAILRAQVSTLRDEADSLRQLLVQKRNNKTSN